MSDSGDRGAKKKSLFQTVAALKHQLVSEGRMEGRAALTDERAVRSLGPAHPELTRFPADGL